MSVTYRSERDKLDERLRAIYKMGMPRAIESQKVVEAKKSFFFESMNTYMKNKIEIFVKNVEYLKLKHEMSDYKMGDFIFNQTGISIYKTTAIGFLVARKRINIDKLLFHAEAVAISFDIDPLELISTDIEYADSRNFVKKFWK
tara:strand:- start:527 stop:958 length:432 start_codon:yes stop_codon:yes gene_type:complete